VALKILHDKYTDPGCDIARVIADRFVLEAALGERLPVRGLVEIIEVIDQRPRVVAIVMERLYGQDLAAAAAAMSLEMLIEAFARTADILAQLHTCGVIHRDVKPKNIFVAEAPDGSKSVKLLDLGIAKDMAFIGDSTATGAIFGTLATIAPETVRRILGERVEITDRADQWGLGATAFQLLSGQAPFQAETVLGTFELITKGVAPLLDLDPRLGGRDAARLLDPILRRSLSVDPAERFGSIKEMALAFRRALGTIIEAATYADTVRIPRVAPPRLVDRDMLDTVIAAPLCA